MMIIQLEIYYVICVIKIFSAINLSRQTNMSIPQQTNFAGKLEEEDHATMFFITKRQQKIIVNFFLDSLIVTE